MTRLGADQARTIRLRSLLLAGAARTPPANAAEIVEWFGGMQAQDLGSGLWSLGSRLPGWTRDDVSEAIERREVLRTWPMRGTVHFVLPRDARWMLDLMGSRALAGAAKRRESLGLPADVADKAVDVLGEGLTGGGRLTRAECVDLLRRNGIEVGGQLTYHLIWYASQRGVTCIGPSIGSEQTIVLLDDWAPEQVSLEREEALRTIAVRYVRSHGPATVKDLAGWTGLPLGDVRRGLAAAGACITTVDVDGVEMLVMRDALETLSRSEVEVAAPEGVLALAGFDEFMLGYKDRSLFLAPGDLATVVPGGNGVFQWTIVRDGRVVATWKRSTTKTKVTVDVLPLTKLGTRERKRIEAALGSYGSFVARPLQLRWSD